MATIRREDGYYCACPGNPPTVPAYTIAVPTGGCEGACQGGVRTPDNPMIRGERPRRRTTTYNNMSGMGSNGSMSVGAYAISMLSVGVLFFVIGYGYYKGKESA